MAEWNVKPSAGGGGDFPKAPAGNHPAVLVAIIDMGMQENEFQGVKKDQHRAYFCWELVTEKVPGAANRNFTIGLDLTVSLNEKAKLRAWIEARLGKKISDDGDYDITKELGQSCLLNVIMKGEWPKIGGLGPIPKGLTVPAPLFKPFLWQLSDISPEGKFTLPDWIPWLYGEPLADHIRRCKQLSGATAKTAQPSNAEMGSPADPVPF